MILSKIINGDLGSVVRTKLNTAIDYLTALVSHRYTYRGPWTISTNYIKNDVILMDSTYHVCLVPHLSIDFASDGDGRAWAEYNPVHKHELQNGLLDNRYYTETEIDDKLIDFTESTRNSLTSKIDKAEYLTLLVTETAYQELNNYQLIKNSIVYLDITELVNSDSFSLILPTVSELDSELPHDHDYEIQIIDVKGSFSKNNAIIKRSNKKIMGLGEDLTLNLNYLSLKLRYINTELGWVIQ